MAKRGRDGVSRRDTAIQPSPGGESFGAFLKRHRGKGTRPLSVKQLSEIVGCPEWYLRRLESGGISKPRPDVLLRLISFFGWEPGKVAEIFESPRRNNLRAEIARYERLLQGHGLVAAKGIHLRSMEAELAYYSYLRALARANSIDETSAD